MNKFVIKKKEDMNQKVFHQLNAHVPNQQKNDLLFQIDPQACQRDNNSRKSEKDFQIIEQCLGSGAYGSVQLVRDVNSRIYYARKTISKSKLKAQESIDNLKREVLIQKKLCHPNILKLCYCYEDSSNVFLILEYAELGSLFSLIKRKQRLQEREAYVFFSQLLSGLEYMHKMQIVSCKKFYKIHTQRFKSIVVLIFVQKFYLILNLQIKMINITLKHTFNIEKVILKNLGKFDSQESFFILKLTILKKNLIKLKRIEQDIQQQIQFDNINIIQRQPENLLITKSGDLKIGDFGWATQMPNYHKAFCGTTEYMSPEMIQSQTTDYKTDIWSLGVLLYEMVQGKPPFQGTTFMEKSQKILSRSQVEFEFDVSDECKSLINSLLQHTIHCRPSIDKIKNHQWMLSQGQDRKGSLRSSSMISIKSTHYTSEVLESQSKINNLQFGQKSSIQEWEAMKFRSLQFQFQRQQDQQPPQNNYQNIGFLTKALIALGCINR